MAKHECRACEDHDIMLMFLGKGKGWAQLFWIRTCIIPAARRTETWTFDQLLDALAALIKPDEREALPADGSSFKCSACNWDGWMDEDAITNYCPKCGAKVASREC